LYSIVKNFGLSAHLLRKTKMRPARSQNVSSGGNSPTTESALVYFWIMGSIFDTFDAKQLVQSYCDLLKRSKKRTSMYLIQKRSIPYIIQLLMMIPRQFEVGGRSDIVSRKAVEG
jgi:hypothetical protein